MKNIDKKKSIVFVRASNYDCTPAILRAIEASAEYFSRIEVLDWSRTGENQVNQSCVSALKISSFFRVAPQRSFKVVLYTLWYQWWLFWKLLFGRYDVVQVCDIMSGVPAIMATLFTGAKLVYDIRDPFALCYRFPGMVSKIAYFVDWLVMSRSCKFVLPTRRYMSYLGRWGKSSREIFVIPNTCKDHYEFLPEPDRNVIPVRRPGYVRLAYLGYLDVSRGSQWLLDFCSDQANKTELIVAGNCRSQELIDKIKGTPNVYYVGRLSYNDCWALMKDVDGITVFYDPSIPVNRVLDPTKFYESMMVGTPVLISKGMSLDSEVRENDLGLIVEHGNIEGLKLAIEQLRDSAFVGNMKRRCRDYYVKNLNLDRQMIQYKDFYKKLADEV